MKTFDEVADLVGPTFEDDFWLERLAAVCRVRTRREMDTMWMLYIDIDTLGLWHHVLGQDMPHPIDPRHPQVFWVDDVVRALRIINGHIVGSKVARKLLDE